MTIDKFLQASKPAGIHYQAQEGLTSVQERRQYFYDVVTEQQKAEFINGKIIIHSHVELQHHAVATSLHQLLSVYVMVNKLGFVGYEKILIVFEHNDYEPDICFFHQAKAQSFTDTQMKFPAPDLAVEVLSDSTAKNDRGIKYQDYAISGVTEYWIIDPEAKVVEQYILQGEEYELRIKSDSGEIHSVAVPGFMIPIRAIFDEQVNLATLRALL